MADTAEHAGATMRIDRYLWFTRLTRTRAAAQTLAMSGAMRIDGRRVDRSHASVRIGSVIAFAQGSHVRIVRVVALPKRRGGAVEAVTMYADLSNPVDVPGSSA